MGAPPELRWHLADAADPQGALFEPVVERHIGKGEYRGMEFLHVNARTIINEVPAASRVPFRFTINAYRGCSHACSYCLAGETPILMADGRTKPLADVEVGDEVYGTVPSGSERRYVKTRVLDHWTTVKRAYRLSLEDGTELVASGDHRFLTDSGWKHVTGAMGSRLLGPGQCFHVAEPAVTSSLGVTGIEALPGHYRLFDITTGTGDFIANGVVSHNCFARPTHAYLGLNTGEDFEKRIVVKVNAVERLRAELAPSRWGGDHIAMGTNTDPYQRCEGKYRLTQGIIRELAAARNPFSILTKSTLILRDLALLAQAAKLTDARANFSIGTLDEDVWRLTEPGTPHPRLRVEAVAKLNAAGVPCGVLVAPVLPGLSDRPDQLEAVVKACVEAGAVAVAPILLHLRPGVREHYLGWLAEARPDLVARYDELYPKAYAPKAMQEALSRQVARLVTRHGGCVAAPSATRSVATRPKPAPAPAIRQLALDV